jgi:CHAT domain-containing protein/Tfp pilus assembly protein PilF
VKGKTRTDISGGVRPLTLLTHAQARLASLLLLITLFASTPGAADKLQSKASAGVIVESVGKGSAAEKAGIQAGDMLISWDRAASPPANPVAAHGQIESPFDLTYVEVEQAPRGGLSLAGKRGPKATTWTVGPGKWEIEARPNLPADIPQLYEEGKNLAEGKNMAQASQRWQAAADAAKHSGRMNTATWLLFRIAKLNGGAEDSEQADAAFESAVKNSEQDAAPAITARLLMAWGQAFQDRKLWDRAEEVYRRALGIREQREQESLEVAETVNALALAALNQKKIPEGEELARRNLAMCQKLAPESIPTVEAFGNLANFQFVRRDLTAAGENIQLALSLVEKLDPGGSREAAILNGMSRVAFGRQDPVKAEDYVERAIAIEERLDPDSSVMAKFLSNAGEIEWRRGDLEKAEGYYRRALAIDEKKSPESRAFAGSLVNVGNVLIDKGDLAGAEKLFTQALALSQKLEPEGTQAGNIFNSLGNVCWSRGDLAKAEEYYRRALAIDEKAFGPESQYVGMVLQNLGNVASDRGDLEAAEAYQRRALAINEKLVPGSLDVAGTLDNLGNIATERGNMDEAERFQRRALELYQKLAPESLDAARNLNNLGVTTNKRGKVEESKQLHQRALAIEAKTSPGSLELAHTLSFLGKRLDELHDSSAAQKNILDALAIQSKLEHNSIDEAESLHALGLSLRGEGKSADAAKYLCQAVDSIEGQKAKLGGTEEQRSGFAAQHSGFYRDCGDALMDLNRLEDAFHVLERSRARSLLAMLAERDLALSADVPAELLRERKSADADYDATQSAIGKLSTAKDAEEVERLLGHLREVRIKQEEVAERIRKNSPRFASLTYPQPLDVTGVREALDQGTVLLSYSVGEKKSALFVLQGAAGAPTGAGKTNGLSVFSLPVGEDALRERIGAFRNLIERHREADESKLQEQAAELYDILMKPAEAVLARSDRILVSPDGPLHTLPFAALVRKEAQGKKGGARRYLIEWKPVHTVVSATVYAELKKSRRNRASPGEIRVTAFGDPKYPTRTDVKPEQIANAELRSAVTRGFSLAPLPSSRVEVESIAGLFPSGSNVYVGEQATEERAKSVGKDVRYLHFAVHGFLDEQIPLNSALALTIPENPSAGQDNGLLQAWEIFEQVRIDADLVTLSACETALGKEMGGEGLVGLARAFQYAGARSVVASLWSVSDESTAELMKRFYGYLKAGKAKDDALRMAQIDLIRAGTQPNHSDHGATTTNAHPFHWAAFELIGDWK